MTTSRMVGVLLGLALVGVMVVALRVDQARVAARIERMQSEETEINREIGRQEMTIAQLRSVQAIREQAVRLGLEASPKEPVRPPAVKTKPVSRPPGRNNR